MDIINQKYIGGYVTNIQKYSLHDGPGIRTIVFLKGCPLRCKWCSNPETQNDMPEIAYDINKCIGIEQCGMCIKHCKTNAIQEVHGKVFLNNKACTNCCICGNHCISKALFVYGKFMEIEEILDEVEKDRIFYSRSGGGLTVSGGEPFNQSEFLIKLLEKAKTRRINTAVETCGYTKWENIENNLKFLDTVLFDIKCIDSEKHKKFTNADNKIILDNFNLLCEKFPHKKKIVRTPVIPGFNDTFEDISQIIKFLRHKPNVKYELLPYHRLGKSKYECIGRKYTMGTAKLDQDVFNSLDNLNIYK